jgi:hypothetical protein
MPSLVFHRLVARDLLCVLSHYTREGAPHVAGEFHQELERGRTIASSEQEAASTLV